MHLHYIILYYLLFIIYLPWLLEESGVPPRTQRVINQYISLRYPYHTSSQTGNTPHADHWAFHQLGSTPAAKSARSSWQHIPWSSHLAWLVSSQITLAPYRNVPCVSLVTIQITWLESHDITITWNCPQALNSVMHRRWSRGPQREVIRPRRLHDLSSLELTDSTFHRLIDCLAWFTVPFTILPTTPAPTTFTTAPLLDVFFAWMSRPPRCANILDFPIH